MGGRREKKGGGEERAFEQFNDSEIRGKGMLRIITTLYYVCVCAL